MDRNYYYEKMHKQREREISRELATRKLLKDGGHEPLTTKQARRLVLRIAPAVIVMAILLFSLFG